ncbi:flavodoxin [Providencia rustigianii]|uniref:Flavodoxin n=2 Tax=Providencia rustigianii TaxID=158850 RepID=D1P1D2_9GAMM|nr:MULTISPECIES: flavodoxin [Providencia]EFB72718.1 flavodoxin [Providencia rustigianii DSM 4541]MTC56710.1 flavodoxin [Providencia rustigianii]MTC58964.1 flavodoxin [Providencia rustigianii]SPY78636.1 flavodoxin [Providencia rustigianii]SUC28286.1 flavodoxin [Providencia rustigianii]
MSKVGIFVGTVYGNSLAVAEVAEEILAQQGHEVVVFDEPTLTDWQSYNAGDGVALVVTSTTGQGDLPDTIAPLFYEIKDVLGYQPELKYGLVALGDSSYDNFCGAGKQFDELLAEQSASRLGDILYIDATEVDAPEEFAKPWVQAWGDLL